MKIIIFVPHKRSNLIKANSNQYFELIIFKTEFFATTEFNVLQAYLFSIASKYVQKVY